MHNDGYRRGLIDGEHTLTVKEILPARICGLVDGTDVEPNDVGSVFSKGRVSQPLLVSNPVATPLTHRSQGFLQKPTKICVPSHVSGQASSHCDEGGIVIDTKTVFHDREIRIINAT